MCWKSALAGLRNFRRPSAGICLGAIRHVGRVIECDADNALPSDLFADIWVEINANAAHAAVAREHNIAYRVFAADELIDFSEPKPAPPSGGMKVAVTGCFDWFHSGHVRFFEEASTFGDLHVFLGNDACIRELKGEGHPLLPQDERRYVVGSIKFVTQAVISSGMGWLDFDQEFRALKPDILIVNEDGDKGGKRDYCRELGIEYLVLKRTPAPGLPKRSSTDLRGF